MRARLEEAGLRVRDSEAAARELTELRERYEPYLNALASFLALELPPWAPGEKAEDDWQVSEWEERRGRSPRRES